MQETPQNQAQDIFQSFTGQGMENGAPVRTRTSNLLIRRENSQEPEDRNDGQSPQPVAIEGSKFSFFVPGIPGTAGSKKFVGHAKATGRAILIDDSGIKGRNWRLAVQWACKGMMEALDVSPFARGVPLLLEIDFQLPRIKGHFNSKGQLRPTAPFWNTVKPDATKMLRAAEDALKDILWHDDGQIASQRITKAYSDRPGAQITVSELITPAQ